MLLANFGELNDLEERTKLNCTNLRLGQMYSSNTASPDESVASGKKPNKVLAGK